MIMDSSGINCCGAATCNSSQYPYTIGGVQIMFPYKAYPSQLTMMDKIVKGLKKKQNCLLESPTGSGKSLALLCASLAWQTKSQKEMEILISTLEAEIASNGGGLIAHTTQEMTECCQTSLDMPLNSAGVCSTSTDHVCCTACDQQSSCKQNKNEVNLQQFNFTGKVKKDYKPGIQFFDSEDDVDFQPTKKQRTSECMPSKDYQGSHHLQSEACTPKRSDFIPLSKTNIFTSPATSGSPVINLTNECFQNFKKIKGETQTLVQKVPKIYFGTRTHKQISQIIRELKKTPYKNSKMTILSSRERTCIHPTVSRADNKKDECDALVRDSNVPACVYYRNFRNVTHNNPPGLSEAWDLEDFIFKLKKSRTCPYFASRQLLDDSDIVFCPYNYLIDPIVRSSLGIDLTNCVVIIDEAHNLEDSASDAASCSITLVQLQMGILELERISQSYNARNPSSYLTLMNVLIALCSWLRRNNFSTYGSSSNTYSSIEMLAFLTSVGAGPESLRHLENCYEMITIDESENEKEYEFQDKVSGPTLSLIKGLLITLNYMYRENQMFLPHYRCVVTKKKSTLIPYNNRSPAMGTDELSVNFLCMYPAVAFSDLKAVVHTLIVTSGTLSPMASFQSELNMPFEITLEANHVVGNSQMWVGTVAHGPQGQLLNGTFRNAETFAFQDEVGRLVLEVCDVISHGVLCFFPSYSMLDKLISRWQATRLWNDVSQKKIIVCEPRGGKDFELVMNEFYDAIKDTETHRNSTVNGALFFAVCRGKVSEGLDFSDNNARAVITIGIPFPNIKDSYVDLKKRYNNLHSSTSNIMSGNEWYETQAFRALNQALGRCIRHRHDFGALIIVDERFQTNHRYINSLSKWIRNRVSHFSNFAAALESLIAFSKKSGVFPKPDHETNDDDCVIVGT